LLLDAINDVVGRPNGVVDIIEDLTHVKQGLNKWGNNINDAPDLRSFSFAYTKKCLA
jgi:hypothetical protein